MKGTTPVTYDLSSMKLLAQGGQADIYEIDKSKILRVLRSPDPNDGLFLLAERTIMTALRQQGVGVPEVYEYAEVNGLPALAMEKITGPSMLDKMLKNPFTMRSTAQELARLHCGFVGTSAVEGLADIKKRIDTLIDISTSIDEDDRAFVRAMLGDLPEGESLLHGDFHPGNILTSGINSYIIDWFGA
jgi:serine/threonine protein kinase